jgi:hypothetical protein
VPPTNSQKAASHSPCATQNSAPVLTMPSPAQNSRKALRRPALSATAPNKGASTATMKPATPLAMPSRAVLVVGSTPTLQNFWKNSGKNPAITVVANAELAQS